MSSWVYVFSKFTPEALLFEALAIFLLICAYTAFWILRKHKFGATHDMIPAGVAKQALNQLIGDAEAMRAQLFGILGNSAAGHSGAIDPALLAALTSRGSAPAHGAAGAGDPEIQTKLVTLETKVAEQNKVVEKIQAEKTKLEGELTAAKASGGAGGGDNSKLNEKIQSLEARLAEYSVIEDDLANLKRLQQENAQLKAALANAGNGAGATAAAPPTQAAAPAPAPTPKAEPATVTDIPPPKLEAAVPAAEVATPTLEPVLEAVETPTTQLEAAAPAAAEPAFEALVDSVEESLKTKIEPAAAAAPTPTPKAAAPAAAAPPSEKSDEDLIAEFEKMLNS